MEKTEGIPIEKAGQFAAQHLTSGQNQCCRVFHSDQTMGAALVLSADRYAQLLWKFSSINARVQRRAPPVRCNPLLGPRSDEGLRNSRRPLGAVRANGNQLEGTQR